MEVTTTSRADVALVTFSGNLDTGTAEDAQVAFDEVLDGGTKKVAVDFTDLDYIASSGLRVLLATAKRLGAAGGQLRIFGLNDTVKEVFDISGFSTIFSVYTTEAEALEEF